MNITKDKKTIILWSATILLVLFAILFSAIKNTNSSSSDKTRIDSITKQLRCLECEGLSVYDSDTTLSSAIKNDVEKKVKKGESDSKIVSYYVSTYGEFIRLNPTSNDGNWAVYVFPVSAILILLLAVFVYTRKSKQINIGSKLKLNSHLILWVFIILTICTLGVIYKIDISNSDNKVLNTTKTLTTTTTIPEELEKTLINDVRTNPNALTYRALGLFQFARENYLDSLRNLDMAASLDPKDAASRAYASYIVLRAQQYESAKTRAQSAIDADHNNVPALFFQGLILRESPVLSDAEKQENIDKSNKNFDLVLQLDPNGEFSSQINEIRN
ncbi:MAG: cytochrome c-type biogenesis protein CcmH [Acidimicrobiia bacterium]|nr:cytochrome c-type biogenesis protein CcmH [Acidimicrobiia bacterium]